MIDKNKLREFLVKENVKANDEIAKGGAIHIYYYNLGHAHATAETITKLDAGEFDSKEGDKHV